MTKMQSDRDRLVAENRRLCEARQLVLVEERVMVPGGAITAIFGATEAKARRYRVAKVGQADRMNQNERVYPMLEWKAQIDRANGELIPQGRLAGATDHATAGGNLRDTSVLWKSLSMDSTGAVEGEFEVLSTRAGKDLQACLDAGMGIGFSTSGYANAREPTPVEREAYRIPEDAAYPVVIENWSLRKIDAVDDPSVADAWDKREAREGVADRLCELVYGLLVTSSAPAVVRELASALT